MKILNLYAGIGGNRKLWKDVEVTAVELDSRIASVYSKLYPEDTIIEGDAHQFLLENYDKFDFIWSSPPCQTHSRMNKATRHKLKRYVDLSLYEEIILLRDNFEGHWIVENVVPYYTPLINPSFKVGRHLFWSNKDLVGIKDVERPKDFINLSNLDGKKKLQDWLDIHFEETIYYKDNHCPAQILRNAIHPKIGEQILEVFKDDTD